MCVLALQTICADGDKTWHFNLIAHYYELALGYWKSIVVRMGYPILPCTSPTIERFGARARFWGG